MQPKRLAILGVGLLGGSLGLALRSVVSNCKIIGYGHRSTTLDKAVEVGAIDVGTTDPAAAVAGADLIVLCTPVGTFRDLLSQIRGNLTPGAIVTDVGSTKRSVVEAAEAVLSRGAHFVGSHPMAGSEKRGVEFARTDLFQRALCILTPTPRTDPAAVEKVDAFWKLLGMRTCRLSPEDHDRLLADVSHLPHVTAAALVTLQQQAGLNLSGKGFLDTTRIASGDGALWRDILLDNRDNLRSSIHHLQSELNHLLSLLESNDPAAPEHLRQWLDAASSRREQLMAQKLRELSE